MADILVRDVDMPIDCRSCWMRSYCYERGIGIWGYGKGKPCPLIQLPEGYGRLIDADALMSDFIKAKWEFFSDSDTFLRLLEQAPTIIPAEGDNN